MKEIVVDNFAGGGGASTGIEHAIGRSVDVAINHDPDAIAMHEANHPNTKHYCESVWDVHPRDVANGRPVALCWLSPDCKHFSKAKGGTPVNKKIRGLAWIAVRWAATVKPRVIILENVEEFKTWGPLIVTKDGPKPDPKKKGKTFQSFVRALERQGYHVEFKELRACDYGAPTTRKRLFMIARRDHKPIVWPTPTHGPRESKEVAEGKYLPYQSAASCIDWSIPGNFIFGRKKPLRPNTLKRIARGLNKFVLNTADPYIVRIDQTSYGKVKRTNSIVDHHSLVQVKMHNGDINRELEVQLFLEEYCKSSESISNQEVAFLTKYYGSDIGQHLNEPLHTIPTKDRFGLVKVKGSAYRIVDITMRMLQPHELAKAQGVPDTYVLDKDKNGKKISKAKQVARIGNMVVPNCAEALVRENLPELCCNQPFNEQVELLNEDFSW
ncbi:C-5 cytosine-specific DNA methylase [Enterococcus faecalis 599]|uniref:DNA cytosine methyltransferase n=1 Tax=Enterococcus faecalis TaxID=1351 RepID=UPI00027C7C96|nr:DNA cytosine methyltransferase [Enterococcus faecalis]EJU93055.1 C-5 cytosine-specific DNA methylase [Enterococcus faecalis 599]WGH71218.1 DNA cytosine methyltransferase [Enterococcus faecalis OG1RF]